MSDLNSLVIQGRIVRNATFRILDSEKKVADFSIATNRMRKTKSGAYAEEANFFHISTFVNSDSFTQYLRKGQRIIIEGFLRQDRWEKDGQKRSANNITVRKIHLIFDSKKTSEEETTPDEEMLEDDGMMNVNEMYLDSYDSYPEDIV